MKYMGSKARIAKHILPIILKDRDPEQWYVEPFLGGANIIDKVSGKRIGGEINLYIAEMWKDLLSGKNMKTITSEEYKDIRNNKDHYEASLVGWVGIACSYSGKWFGGFAGKVHTRDGIRDYQEEAHKNLEKQIKNLYGIKVYNCSYDELPIPKNSIIYCDPPYNGTTQYKDKFDNIKFWEWCREKCKEGHQVFISEYEAPDDFVCVWSQEVKSSLSANGVIGGSKKSVEKLFVHKSQI